MKHIGILTAGGDTPALNATIHGAVTRANEQGIAVTGIIRGFSGLIDARLPHVRLNPLFATIPELDPCRGGTILGASRTYLDPQQREQLDGVNLRLQRLGIEGLICVGGDGTISGMQPLTDHFPCVLAPKTIDNDLGLNYIDEPNDWLQTGPATTPASREWIDLEEIINFATPGYATSVFVVIQGVERLRTTAESHRRIAIIEVMGRDSGYIALGSAYGQPDIILIPEIPLDINLLAARVKKLYELQRNVVIVVGEGIVDQQGNRLGATSKSYDPAGNLIYSGAAEALKNLLTEHLSLDFFRSMRSHESPDSVIFTRKVGHTQRGGRPIKFDRFYASQIGGKAVDLLVQKQNNYIATLQWTPQMGLHVDSLPANKLRDRWNCIHPRRIHHSFYDSNRFMPSDKGNDYLHTMLSHALGPEDMEYFLQDTFNTGKLTTRYQSINIDIQRLVRYM